MVHHAAAAGFERGVQAYDRARPEYHPEVARRVAACCGDGPVAEVGAGSGILTRQLVALGVHVIGLEPVPSMRMSLRASLPGIPVMAAAAEALPLRSASFEAVVAAQSFHWFQAIPAIEEIARVLRPGGHLITVWNVRDENVPWVARYTEVMDRHAGDAPRYRTLEWRSAIERDARFELVEEWSIDNPVATDAQGVIDRARSTSFIASLSNEDQAEIAAELSEIVEPLGGSISFPYRCEFQAWKLR